MKLYFLCISNIIFSAESNIDGIQTPTDFWVPYDLELEQINTIESDEIQSHEWIHTLKIMYKTCLKNSNKNDFLELYLSSKIKLLHSLNESLEESELKINGFLVMAANHSDKAALITEKCSENIITLLEQKNQTNCLQLYYESGGKYPYFIYHRLLEVKNTIKKAVLCEDKFPIISHRYISNVSFFNYLEPSNMFSLFPEDSIEIEKAISSGTISISNLNLNHFYVLVEFFSSVFIKKNELKILKFADSSKQYYVQDFMEGALTLFMAEETFLVTPFRFHQIKTYSILEIENLIQALEKLNVSDDEKNIAIQNPDTNIEVKDDSITSSATSVGIVKKKKSKKKSKKKASHDLELFDEDAFLNEAIKQNQKIKTSWEKYDERLRTMLTAYQDDIQKIYIRKMEFYSKSLDKDFAERRVKDVSEYRDTTNVEFLQKLQYFREHLDNNFKKVQQNMSSAKSFIAEKNMPLNCDFLTIWYGFGLKYEMSPDVYINLIMNCATYKSYSMKKTGLKLKSKVCFFYIVKPLDLCDYYALVDNQINLIILREELKRNEIIRLQSYFSRYEGFYFSFSKKIVLEPNLKKFKMYGKTYDCHNYKYDQENFDAKNSQLYSFVFPEDIERYVNLKIKSTHIREINNEEFSDLKSIFSSVYKNEIVSFCKNPRIDIFYGFGENSGLKLFVNLPVIFVFEEFVFQVKMLKVYLD
ncbi:hypothetical protein NUSPORA_01368 [Nucleospora cyclopteri]